MQRYFVSYDCLQGDRLKLNDADFFHVHQVMRMKKGDQVTCVDEDGQVYLCALIENDSPLLQIIRPIEENHELDIRVRLLYGLPKLDKFEWVVQKCTELGVSEIVPLLSKRSLIKTDATRFAKKAQRLRKIIKEACEQSQREKLVVLHEPMGLKQAAALSCDFGLVADEEEGKNGESRNLALCLKQLKAGDTLNIVVGPEGGFDREEIIYLKAHHYCSCALGPRILRSETAPLYLMSVIGFYRELREEL